MGLLFKDFASLVLIAFIVAVPVAYVAAQKWLEGFAFRIGVDPLVFAVAGGLAMLIAFLSTGYQAVRVARHNPVESLRYE